MHIFIYKETNKAEKPCDNTTKTAFGDFPYTLVLLSDAKCDVLCFAIGTFACTVRGQNLQNLIEKICFLHFSITSCLMQKPISHTVCQSKDGEKKSGSEDGKRNLVDTK